MFFYHFTLNLLVSLYFKWVSLRYHITDSCFFIQSDNLCLQLECLDHLYLMYLLIQLGLYLPSANYFLCSVSFFSSYFPIFSSYFPINLN